jgi:hypothetical protein
MHLSKSDFKTARQCPAKLYYKKNRYPSTSSEDRYMAYLAEGGFMVEEIAHLLFPEGQELPTNSGDTASQAAATVDWIQQTTDGVLFEAVIAWESFMARIDILEKKGNTLRLIEVKSISVDTSESGTPLRGARGGIVSGRIEYVEDVCYQASLLQRAYPDYEIQPQLCVVDKARAVSEAATMDKFTLTKIPGPNGYDRTNVSYTGDAEALRNNYPLVFLDVDSEWKELRDSLWLEAERFADSLSTTPITKITAPLGTYCKNCEYRYASATELLANPDLKDGFRECWGEKALCPHPVIDLYYASFYGGKNSGLMQVACESSSADLRDLDTDCCTGTLGERQRIQITHSRNETEYIDPNLPATLNHHAYPLHFIDFETTRTALPYHAGMHPYELITFQWSCHTIPSPGAPMEHSEWIHRGDDFPNFEFARSLKEQIGDDGTVYIWSHHENSCMKAIAKQLDDANIRDPDLASWLLRFEEGKDKRVIDLCALARKYYFHPDMKGSCSIKAVLPAIWKHNPGLWEEPDFATYHQEGVDGQPQSPYKTLPDISLPNGQPLSSIAEGTGAIRAYEEMRFGLGSQDPAHREALTDLLLQYCKLDTAAMVIIWKYWCSAT